MFKIFFLLVTVFGEPAHVSVYPIQADKPDKVFATKAECEAAKDAAATESNEAVLELSHGRYHIKAVLCATDEQMDGKKPGIEL